MKRGTIFPILFVLISLGILGASFLISETEPDPPPPPPSPTPPGPLALTLAVHPLLFEWVAAATDAFNETATTVNGRPVQVIVTEAPDDMAVWYRNESGWSTVDHPDAWIPASSLGLGYTAETLPFEAQTTTLASSPLLWMAYASRADAIAPDGTPLDWPQVGEAAGLESWGAIDESFSATDFIRIGFNNPLTSADGLAVLLAAAAGYHQTTALTAAQTSDAAFRAWLAPVVDAQPRNIIGGLGAYAARSNTTVHLALATEATWLSHLPDFLRNEDVRFSYPAYNVSLDFPLAAWVGAGQDPDQAAALLAFSDWLLAPDQQARLTAYGLRPVNDDLTTASAPLFADAMPYGVTLDAAPGVPLDLTALTSNDLRSLLTWYNNARR